MNNAHEFDDASRCAAERGADSAARCPYHRIRVVFSGFKKFLRQTSIKARGN
jgi:hypothetical protein